MTEELRCHHGVAISQRCEACMAEAKRFFPEMIEFDLYLQELIFRPLTLKLFLTGLDTVTGDPLNYFFGIYDTSQGDII